MNTDFEQKQTEGAKSSVTKAVDFWMPVITVTAALVIACILFDRGTGAIALALLVQVEFKCLEYDSRGGK